MIFDGIYTYILYIYTLGTYWSLPKFRWFDDIQKYYCIYIYIFLFLYSFFSLGGANPAPQPRRGGEGLAACELADAQ